MAAHRSGLKTVILPSYNEADLEDIPDEVRKEIQFVFAETVDDVLQAALEPPSQVAGQDQKPTNEDPGPL